MIGATVVGAAMKENKKNGACYKMFINLRLGVVCSGRAVL